MTQLPVRTQTLHCAPIPNCSPDDSPAFWRGSSPAHSARLPAPRPAVSGRGPNPGWQDQPSGSALQNLLALVVGTAIAWENRTLFALTSLVTIVTIVVRWATLWRPTNPVILWRASTGLAAILMITTILLWQVFRSGPVTAKRVQGALAAYLCLGFAWAHAYHIAALLDPGAFNSAGSDVSGVSTWVNYSFGMLTTVGYQGILPVHPVAHTLGSGEAVAGQLYLAVLVARLVSMQVSSAAKGD
jgi:hypothetical protein